MTRIHILAFMATALSAAASAQTAPRPISRSDYLKIVDGHFNTGDTNHDGFVSKAELVAQQERDLASAKERVNQQLSAQFRQLDTNHDGKLTVQEFLAGAPAVRVSETADQLLQRLDANHDGKISAEEFRNPELAKFNKVDTNHDGIVSVQEQQAARGK